MINITQAGWEWPELEAIGECPQPQLWHSPAERISELLGPDGEPLKVPFGRPRIGFDLTPKPAPPATLKVRPGKTKVRVKWTKEW